MTIDPSGQVGLEELDRLAQQVDAWFRQATNRFVAPPTKGCRAVAFYLLAFRHPVRDKRPDTRKQALKHGKLFLAYIEPERRRIEEMVSLASRSQPFGNWLEEAKETLYRIGEVQRHIEALLLLISPKRDAKPDPIRTIALAAQQVWADANNGRFPRSKNPDDPLCRFLDLALAGTHDYRSPAAISDVLRCRRRKPTDGQNQ